jgi:hypothetical protein
MLTNAIMADPHTRRVHGDRSTRLQHTAVCYGHVSVPDARFAGHIHIATNVFSGFVDRYGGQRDMRVPQVGTLGTRLNSISPMPYSGDVWFVAEHDNSPITNGNLAERYTCI